MQSHLAELFLHLLQIQFGLQRVLVNLDESVLSLLFLLTLEWNVVHALVAA